MRLAGNALLITLSNLLVASRWGQLGAGGLRQTARTMSGSSGFSVSYVTIDSAEKAEKLAR